MPQADLGPVAFLAQCFFLQRLMNGYGKVTNVTHFNAIVGASCNELRHRLPLQDATDEDKRDLPLRSVQEFQCLRFLPIRAGVRGDNKVIGVLAQVFAKLLGSNNDLRTDREVHFIELLQAAFYFRCVTVDKEDVQRRMSAFRSPQGISLEAGLWRRSHQRLGKIPGAGPSLCHTGPRECSDSKHINSCKMSPGCRRRLTVNFRTRCEPTYFPSGFDAVHHGHTDVENYQIELSSLTFSNACLPFSASPQIPRESRVRRDRIPLRIASWSLTIRIHVRTPFALASANHSSRTT